MTKNNQCENCGCVYWHEPDIGAEKNCNFPYFDYSQEQENYKKNVCWAEQES